MVARGGMAGWGGEEGGGGRGGGAKIISAKRYKHNIIG